MKMAGFDNFGNQINYSNQPKLTQAQWNEFQEFKDEYTKSDRIKKVLLQEINDNLRGGLTSRNIKSFRNTYVINAQDSLDDSYPMYVHFNIINEMIKIVSVKVSFWILNYRAYSKAAASGGAVSSASGGGETPTSSSVLTPSCGENTSGPIGVISGSRVGPVEHEGLAIYEVDVAGSWVILTYAGGVALSQHIHSTPAHTHPAHDHTVTIAAHTHTGGAHTHDAVYGIFEEETSPIIKFYISENEGVSYNDKFFGNYDTDKSDLEITSLLTGVGSKLIKFTSDLRARLSVQIEIKLDIKAR